MRIKVNCVNYHTCGNKAIMYSFDITAACKECIAEANKNDTNNINI